MKLCDYSKHVVEHHVNVKVGYPLKQGLKQFTGTVLFKSFLCEG